MSLWGLGKLARGVERKKLFWGKNVVYFEAGRSIFLVSPSVVCVCVCVCFLNPVVVVPRGFDYTCGFDELSVELAFCPTHVAVCLQEQVPRPEPQHW
jgi:hypothetical protein